MPLYAQLLLSTVSWFGGTENKVVSALRIGGEIFTLRVRANGSVRFSSKVETLHWANQNIKTNLFSTGTGYSPPWPIEIAPFNVVSRVRTSKELTSYSYEYW